MSNLGELNKRYEKLPLMENLGRLGQKAREHFERTGQLPDRLLTSLKDLPPTDFTDILQRIRGQQGLNPGAAPFQPPPPPPPPGPPPLPPGPPPRERVRTSEPPRTEEGRAKAQSVYDHNIRRKASDEPSIAEILRKNYEYIRTEEKEKSRDLIRGVIHALETVLLERGREDLVLDARRRAR